jgi:serine protease Do
MRYALPILIVLTLCAAVLVSPALAADQTIKVYVDGKPQSFNPAAVVRDNKAYVPLRQVGTALGATTSYNGQTGVVTMIYCGKIARIAPSEGITIAGSKFVPLRKISDAFGCKIAFDATTSVVQITKPTSGG